MEFRLFSLLSPLQESIKESAILEPFLTQEMESLISSQLLMVSLSIVASNTFLWLVAIWLILLLIWSVKEMKNAQLKKFILLPELSKKSILMWFNRAIFCKSFRILIIEWVHKNWRKNMKSLSKELIPFLKFPLRCQSVLKDFWLQKCSSILK